MHDNKMISSIFEILTNVIQYPGTELKYKNDYTFCVAVILSAQAKDSAVNKVTERLFSIADNPHSMLQLGDELVEIIQSIGLFNNKAKNIMQFSKEIIEKFEGRIPKDRDLLESLRGIGRKSANVIANTLFQKPFIAVDTHVLRVSKRLGLSDSSSPTAVEKELMAKIPVQYHINASNLLVLHGRYVCLARNPKCEECPIKHLCRSHRGAIA